MIHLRVAPVINGLVMAKRQRSTHLVRRACPRQFDEAGRWTVCKEHCRAAKEAEGLRDIHVRPYSRQSIHRDSF